MACPWVALTCAHWPWSALCQWAGPCWTGVGRGRSRRDPGLHILGKLAAKNSSLVGGGRQNHSWIKAPSFFLDFTYKTQIFGLWLQDIKLKVGDPLGTKTYVTIQLLSLKPVQVIISWGLRTALSGSYSYSCSAEEGTDTLFACTKPHKSRGDIWAQV